MLSGTLSFANTDPKILVEAKTIVGWDQAARSLSKQKAAT
jgi:hypothetical protein